MEFLRESLTQLLMYIHSFAGNFTISIVLLTILVKLALLPLTLKQDKSMKAMKDLAPELEKIKEKYKNDKQMVNVKTMELYKEKKINPIGGCFPMLLQMPILFALFGVLRTPGVIPVDETFLFWNLAQTDPYFVFPLLNGAVTFFQQKFASPSTGNSQQAKIMGYMMPVMMIMFAKAMPVGLLIYWITSSLISILQSVFIFKTLSNDNIKTAEVVKSKKKK